MTTSTFFALMAEFGTVEVELGKVCEKYFGLSEDKAKARAQVQGLPVHVHRCGSRKSPWLVNLHDLARHIDLQRSKAEAEWKKMNGTAA